MSLKLSRNRQARAICLAGVAASFAVLPAHADDETTPVPVPPVVVSATRLPTPENEVASSVTVITSEDIENMQARTLPDLLEQVPGLNVVQTGGPGESASVYIRGANANQTKVLIDGIDASDPSTADGTFDFAHILTSDIERIEVLRGPQSGLYGADAIGGVINIITKKGSGPAQFTGTLEGGSFGTFNQSAGLSGSLDRWSYAFNVAHFHANDTPVTPSGAVPAGVSVQGDSYDNKTVSTKLGAGLTDNFDLGLVARFVDTALFFTGSDFFGMAEPLQSEADTHQLFTRGTAHLALFDGVFEQTVGLAYTDYRRRYFDPNPADIALGGDPTYYDGDRVKVDWQGDIKLTPGQTLTLGAEHELDQISDSSPVRARVANDAGYAQLQSSFGERLFDSLSLRYDNNEQFGGKATWRVAPAYLVPETGTKLKGTVGTGFNPPTLDELYESFPAFFFFANPNLQPETSLGYDLGFEQTLLDKKLQFGATYFHNDIKNLITLNDTATSFVNVGRATTSGVESFADYRPWAWLDFRADYTYTLAEDDILHEELLRRPRHKATLNATWQATDAFSITATLLYVGPWYDADRAGLYTGMKASGYGLVNIAASYDLGHGVTAFARIDNLLDRHYQDPIGFQHPGLGVFGGLKVTFTADNLGL